MRIYILVLLSLSSLGLHAQKPDAKAILKRNLPDDWVVLAEQYGDLNKDSLNDAAIVIEEMNGSDDLGKKRRLFVYFNMKNGDWIMISSSDKIIGKSEEGGLLGDPFDGITISKGILSVSSFAGSADKSNKTCRFRYQNNDFFMIGLTDTETSANGTEDYYDFNLSTGKLYRRHKDYENSRNNKEEMLRHAANPWPTLSAPFDHDILPGVKTYYDVESHESSKPAEKETFQRTGTSARFVGISSDGKYAAWSEAWFSPRVGRKRTATLTVIDTERNSPAAPAVVDSSNFSTDDDGHKLVQQKARPMLEGFGIRNTGFTDIPTYLGECALLGSEVVWRLVINIVPTRCCDPQFELLLQSSTRQIPLLQAGQIRLAPEEDYITNYDISKVVVSGKKLIMFLQYQAQPNGDDHFLETRTVVRSALLP